MFNAFSAPSTSNTSNPILLLLKTLHLISLKKKIRRKAPSDPTTCLPAFVARYAPLPWINFPCFYLGRTPSLVYHTVWPPSTQSHRPGTLSPLPHCRFLPCTGLFPSAGQHFFFFSNVKKKTKQNTLTSFPLRILLYFDFSSLKGRFKHAAVRAPF